MKSTLFRFSVELTLWSIANLLCIGLATSAVYLVGTNFLDWGPASVGFFVPLTAIMTSTWGAWSSLVWARNRGVRAGMYVSASIPGIVLMIAGAAGMWFFLKGWLVWTGFIVGGLAMVGVTSALCRRFNPRSHSVPTLSNLYGLFVHPIVTLGATGSVAAVWYTFVSSSGGGWRNLGSLSTLMASLLAFALITTVIPAATSTLCRKLALESGDRFKRM